MSTEYPEPFTPESRAATMVAALRVERIGVQAQADNPAISDALRKARALDVAAIDEQIEYWQPSKRDVPVPQGSRR